MARPKRFELLTPRFVVCCSIQLRRPRYHLSHRRGSLFVRLRAIAQCIESAFEEQRRGAALGAADYLTKPIDRERLRRLLDRFRAPAPPTRVLLVEDDQGKGWSVCKRVSRT